MWTHTGIPEYPFQQTTIFALALCICNLNIRSFIRSIDQLELIIYNFHLKAIYRYVIVWPINYIVENLCFVVRKTISISAGFVVRASKTKNKQKNRKHKTTGEKYLHTYLPTYLPPILAINTTPCTEINPFF